MRSLTVLIIFALTVAIIIPFINAEFAKNDESVNIGQLAEKPSFSRRSELEVRQNISFNILNNSL